ncbi:hypothetical protein TNCV_4170641 [Trichonephila clavipes]|nr:hypothetical protein TNCV_4170641 [Trichonephila clavipes]
MITLLHTDPFLSDFLQKSKTTVLPPPSYPPDFSPGHFSLFPKPARCLKGRRFQSADEVKSASQAELKTWLKVDSRNASTIFTKD